MTLQARYRLVLGHRFPQMDQMQFQEQFEGLVADHSDPHVQRDPGIVIDQEDNAAYVGIVLAEFTPTDMTMMMFSGLLLKYVNALAEIVRAFFQEHGLPEREISLWQFVVLE